MNTLEFQTEILKSVTKTKKEDSRKTVTADYLLARKKMFRQFKKLQLSGGAAAEAAKTLTDRFIVRWMSLYFPRIDMSFAERERQVLLRRDEVSGDIRVAEWDYSSVLSKLDGAVSRVSSLPLFVFMPSVDLSTNDYTFSRHVGGFESRRKRPVLSAANARATTQCPRGVTSQHIKRFHLFRSRLLQAISVLERHDIGYTSGGYRRSGFYGQIPDVMSGIVWAPIDTNWSFESEPVRPEGDPAVIATVCEQSFLLDFFETPDEKPIENVLREFSAGTMPKRS